MRSSRWRSVLPACGWQHAGITIALGAVAATGQAPLDLWYLSFFGFCGAFNLFVRSEGARDAAWTGWFFALGHFALALSWIVEPFLVDLARHGWMAPFALVLLSGGLALFWAAAFGIAARFSARWSAVPALVVLWVAAEMLRSILFTGFPWALVGHVLISTQLVQHASYGGGHSLSLIVLGIAAMSVWGRTASKILIIGSLLGLLWGYGDYRARSIETAETGKIIRLLQPNAAQHLKWDLEMIPVFYRRLLELSIAQAPARPDLIVWPETALAYRLDRAEAALEQMAEFADGIPLAFGVNDLSDDLYHNTLAVMGPGGEVAQRYYKHHLVPFGEYLPFGELLSRLGINGLAARDGAGYGAGLGPELIDLPGIGQALPLICYELIFPRNLRNVPRADLILQITNDAWFGNISGPYQHLAQARLRAVEQGLPLLRSANTGVSAAIDPVGRVVSQLALNNTGFLDVGLPLALPPTIYARYHDWPIGIALLVALAGAIFARRVRQSD